MSENAPEKPKSLPADARWDPKYPGFEWVEGALDDSGERHGPYRSWNKEGVLHGECTYVHGECHGPNKNFHPDGSLSSVGEWRNGVLYDCNHFRPQVESPEPWPDDVGENVWKARYVSTDGKSNRTILYFDRDGNQIGMEGEPLPPRPEGVPESARHFPEMDMWVDGAIQRQTNNQIGPWKWWTTGGELQREEDRDDAGHAYCVREYENGVLDTKSTYNSADVRVDYESYFDSGALFLHSKKNEDGKEIFEARYTRAGDLREQTDTEWDGDEIVSRRELGHKGELAFEARREEGELACTLFHDNGKASVQGPMRGDKLVGTWTFFDEDGKEKRQLDVGKYNLESSPTHERLPWRLNEALFETLEPEIPEVEQLAGSRDIDWAKVESCFGDTADFHRYLRGLVSDEPRVQAYAQGSIYGEVLHQGTVYEATARVMPFLIALLEHEHSDTWELVSMIRDLGMSAAPYANEAREALEEADDDDDDTEWTFAVLGTVEAIGKGWAKLWELIDSEDEEIRQWVLSMTALPPPSPEIKKALLDFAGTDESPHMRACAVEALSNLEGATPEDLLPYFADESPLVQATAAIEMGLTFGPESPSETVDVLKATFERWKAIVGDYYRLPFVDIHLLARLALAVGCVRNDDARQLAIPMCELLEEVDGQSAVVYGQGLLVLCLGKGELPFAADFVRVLETLSKSRSFNVFNVNAAEVLEMWNLPRYAKELGEYVEKLKTESDPEAALHAMMHSDNDDDDDEGGSSCCSVDEEDDEEDEEDDD